MTLLNVFINNFATQVAGDGTTHSEDEGRGGTQRRPNSRATPQEVVPKMARWRGSDAEQF